MSSELVPVPRRRTPARRAWTLRMLMIGAMPLLTAAVCVATLRVFDIAQAAIAQGTAGRPWSDLTGWLFAAIVLLGLIGLIALFDRRTRLSGAVVLMLALFLNPLSSALIRGVLGLELL